MLCVWPFSTASVAPQERLQTRTVRSSDADASSALSGEMAMSVITALCPLSVYTSRADGTYHSLISPSSAPLAA